MYIGDPARRLGESLPWGYLKGSGGLPFGAHRGLPVFVGPVGGDTYLALPLTREGAGSWGPARHSARRSAGPQGGGISRSQGRGCEAARALNEPGGRPPHHVAWAAMATSRARPCGPALQVRVAEPSALTLGARACAQAFRPVRTSRDGSNHCAKGRGSLGRSEGGWREEGKAKIGSIISKSEKKAMQCIWGATKHSPLAQLTPWSSWCTLFCLAHLTEAPEF